MSKRPKIQSKREKRVEKKIQAARKTRDREARARGTKVEVSKKVPEPYILSFSRGPAPGPVPRKVKAWIEAESKQQMTFYRRIYREMERLAPDRARWVKEFYQRISGPRGFSVHAGTRRTIPKNEIPKKPRRPWRVLW
jgi:hypothetical protein